MRKAQSKYCYSTDAFQIASTGDIAKRLNCLYSNPGDGEVISVSIFQNGSNSYAMIVSKKLEYTNQN